MGMKTDYKLNVNDWEFVKELTKVASVKVLSSQVSLSFERSDRDLGTDKDYPLIFPENWSLQYVGIAPSKYEDNHVVKMTWQILNN